MSQKLQGFVVLICFLRFCKGLDKSIPINVTVGELKENYERVVGNNARPDIYVFKLPKDQSALIDAQIPSISWNATEKFPLLVNAWTDDSTLSFMLPMTIQGSKFDMARRFLCPSDKQKSSELYVSISSASEDEVHYRLQVRPVEKGKFIISKLDRKTTDFTIGPAWPDAFEFVFPDGVDVVDIVVSAMPDDKEVDQAAVMFIQETKCPMLSLPDEADKAIRTVSFTRHAIATLQRTPNTPSVYLNFVATKNATKPTQKKKINLVITKSGSDMPYSGPIGAVVGISAFIFVFPILLMIGLKISGRRGSDERPTGSMPIGEGAMAQAAVYEPAEQNVGQGDLSRSRDRLTGDPESDDRIAVYPAGTLTFNRQKRLHWIHLSHAHFVLGAVSSVAVLLFFAVMLSLWAEYEKTDQCYFNYECLRYQNSIGAFNHVFSAGFAYGACAMAITICTIMSHCCFPGGQGNGGHTEIRPIIIAVVMCILAQGFLSSLYQSCPTRFLHFTENIFLVLALFLGISAFYYLLPLYSLIGLWMVIVVLGAMSESYHFGTVGRLLSIISSVLIIIAIGFVHIQNTKYMEEKSYREIAYSPVLYVTILWTVIQASTLSIYGKDVMDYPTYITISVIIASCLYMGYHIAQRKENQTTGHYLASLSLALVGLAFWVIGLIFYTQKRVDVLASSALSRSHNSRCELWSFYDANDIWAFCSAYAIFYQFMSLLFHKAI